MSITKKDDRDRIVRETESVTRSRKRKIAKIAVTAATLLLFWSTSAYYLVVFALVRLTSPLLLGFFFSSLILSTLTFLATWEVKVSKSKRFRAINVPLPVRMLLVASLVALALSTAFIHFSRGFSTSFRTDYLYALGGGYIGLTISLTYDVLFLGHPKLLYCRKCESYQLYRRFEGTYFCEYCQNKINENEFKKLVNEEPGQR